MSRKISIKLGDVFTNNAGDSATVVEVKSASKILIQFNDSFAFQYHVKMSQLKAGGFKNPFTPSVWATGFIGAGEYTPKKDKEAYIAWQGMMQRCFDDKLRSKFTSYKDITLASEWHNFQNFAKWFYEESKNKPADQTWHLDKDISRNKCYGPDYCILIPGEINCLILSSKVRRGEYPIGVNFRAETGKYRARCQIGTRSPKAVGEFTTVAEAFNAYKIFKEARIKRLAESYRGVISDRAVEMLMNYTVDIDD